MTLYQSNETVNTGHIYISQLIQTRAQFPGRTSDLIWSMVENLTGIFPMMQGCILDALNKSLGTQAAFTEKRGNSLRIDNRSSESRGAFENLCTWRFFMVNELGNAHRRSSRILVRTVQATDCVRLQYRNREPRKRANKQHLCSQSTWH